MRVPALPVRWKVVLGIVSVPLSTYLAVSAWITPSFVLRIKPFDHDSASGLASDLVMVGGSAAVISTVVAVIFGLPTFFWFRRRGWLSLKSTTAAGFILGVAPFLVFFILESLLAVRLGMSVGASHPHFGVAAQMKNLAAGIPVGLWWLFLGGVCGALSALGFWAIVVRRPRPV